MVELVKRINSRDGEYKCHCGKIKVMRHGNAKRAKSCGCEKCKGRGGITKHPEYIIWGGIVQRCTNINNRDYKDYGAKGITICNEWRDFKNFYIDMGPRPSNKHTVERKDGTKGYCKQNCVWATYKEQNRNHSRNVWIEYKGIKKCLTDWSEELGIHYYTIYSRLQDGWSIEEALTTPKQKYKKCMIIYKGVEKSLKDFAKEFNIPIDTLRARIYRYNWTIEKSIETPIG